MENYQYQNPAAFQSAPAPAGSPAGGELFEGAAISAADLGNYDTNLIPPGEYQFTVVAVEGPNRHVPAQGGKIGECNKYTIVCRLYLQDGTTLDLRDNFFMWAGNGQPGRIAQYYDSIGLHVKGQPLMFDWRPNSHIGKSGRLEINHRAGSNGGKYNNIARYISASGPQGAAAVPQFGTQPASAPTAQPAYTAPAPAPVSAPAPAQPAQPAQPAASPWATAKW